MHQPTFGDLEYESKKRKTRREIFLERMDGLIPWGMLEERIRPYYPEGGPGPAALRVVSDAADTLCAAVLQPPPSRGQILSDPGMEDLLYEAESVRRFVGLSSQARCRTRQQY